MAAQAMEDASPVKWHLAHTSWFFTEFVLKDAVQAPPHWRFLFNSYYDAVGARVARPRRGLITRPSVAEILAWRARVDAALDTFVATASAPCFEDVAALIELGLHHEQQHQELMLTDVLALFAAHPEVPAYRLDLKPSGESSGGVPTWTTSAGGLVEIGADGEGFAFDCERPRHRIWLEPFSISDRPVTNADWCEFIDDGGYDNSLLWLSDGWACVQREGWRAPGYWRSVEGEWRQATLAGLTPVERAAPVGHVSYWEADAFARWTGARLPSEAEWEISASLDSDANFLECDHLRPANSKAGARQYFGDVWEWTQSPFAPYPGFRPASGAVGEYNGKFMASQFVLRGGSCFSPHSHVRASYRNFFYPHQRWQMSGLRLAKDVS
jgi:ergothioneine biosynthesis protein EgtB